VPRWDWWAACAQDAAAGDAGALYLYSHFERRRRREEEDMEEEEAWCITWEEEEEQPPCLLSLLF